MVLDWKGDRCLVISLPPAVGTRPSARNDAHRHQNEMLLIVRGAILIVNIPIVRMGKRTADILERFGQRVRELRKAQGYSQETFAAACALDRTYIGGIERGERNLALRNIEAIAKTLGISLSELMEGL